MSLRSINRTTSFLMIVSFLLAISGCLNKPDPCKGVVCYNGGTTYIEGGCCKCDCPEGFRGEDCSEKTEPDCDVVCKNGGKCVNGKCDCKPGFTGEDCSVVAPCAGVTCYNGGECVDGKCDCPPGYTGNNCETRMSVSSILGNFSVTENCSGLGSANYRVNIAEGKNPGQVIIQNFWNDFKSGVYAVLNGSKLTIPNQSPDGNGIYVSGAGVYKNGVISLRFEVRDVNYNDRTQCTSTWVNK